jgi:hypothetical protein
VGVRIELHIDELVLHGLPPGDRHHIADTLQRELSRLFAEQGVSPALASRGEVGHLDGGSFKVARGAKPNSIGAQVAQAVYGGLNR